MDFTLSRQVDPDKVALMLEQMTEQIWLELDARIARDLMKGVRNGFENWAPANFNADEYISWVK